MDHDLLFQYIKIGLENITVWPIILIFIIWKLYSNPKYMERIILYIQKIKIGSFELEFREIKEKLATATQKIVELENEVERNDARFGEIVSGVDPYAPLSELAATREALRAVAPSMSDLSAVRAGLRPGASPAELFAAAEVVRTRRDPQFFDDVVACLKRLSADENLEGIRLNTVWSLTSALHKTLVAALKNRSDWPLNERQLIDAKEMLAGLAQHKRVLADRPDAPMKGIRGPIKWANDWIAAGLESMRAASSG
ncbi:hypothetical protein EYW49_18335 [Siculibacillus lacustris]|uniref:Uncharacterized protein n=1 Tax=Siculibacillus lacustris TaxID=1549641 RepID=A0A4Q9VI93_9HYPH|nr:hypothetical protein [Siculibacillus lacustris]TBW34398.1 hypothetical protein EYW49_18335 [Siculibacillus lacustris]